MSRFKSNFKETIEKAKQTLEGNDFKDDRFWYSQHDRTKDCTNTLRLMPSKPKGHSYGELCYVIEPIHKFEYVDRNGRKKNFWSPCAKRLLGEDCPECDKVAELWDKYNNQKDGWDPKDSRLKDKLKLHENFVCNIIVLDDPTNPLNNDRVFLTKFQAKGPSVPFKDIVLKQLNPSDSDKKKKTFKQINPFEPYDVDKDTLPGCNFYLDYKAPGKGDSYGNYNSSEFIKNECGPVYEDESKIDEAMDKLYDLNEYLDELRDKIIPYDEVIEKIGHILNGEESISIETGEVSDEDIYEVDDDSKVEIKEDEKPVEQKKEEKKVETKKENEVSGDDLDDSLDKWA